MTLQNEVVVGGKDFVVRVHSPFISHSSRWVSSRVLVSNLVAVHTTCAERTEQENILQGTTELQNPAHILNW